MRQTDDKCTSSSSGQRDAVRMSGGAGGGGGGGASLLLLPKVVPWSSWEEWQYVMEGMFAPGVAAVRRQERREKGGGGEEEEKPEQEEEEARMRQWQREAIDIVDLWRIRGRLPHSVESTVMLTRATLCDEAWSRSETPWASSHELRVQYAMGVVRTVNGLVDRLQQRVHAEAVSSLAGQLGLPGWVVELRHDSTHQQLPTLTVLRLAAHHLLDWLREHYWHAQSQHIHTMARGYWDTLTRFASDLRRSARGNRNKQQQQKQQQIELDQQEIQRLAHQYTPAVSEMMLGADSPTAITSCLLPLLWRHSAFAGNRHGLLIPPELTTNVGSEGNRNRTAIGSSPADESMIPANDQGWREVHDQLAPLLHAMCNIWSRFGISMFKLGAHQCMHLASVADRRSTEFHMHPDRELFFAQRWTCCMLDEFAPSAGDAHSSSSGGDKCEADILAEALVLRLEAQHVQTQMHTLPPDQQSMLLHLETALAKFLSSSSSSTASSVATPSSSTTQPKAGGRWSQCPAWLPCPVGSLPGTTDSAEQFQNLVFSDTKPELLRLPQYPPRVLRALQAAPQLSPQPASQPPPPPPPPPGAENDTAATDDATAAAAAAAAAAAVT